MAGNSVSDSSGIEYVNEHEIDIQQTQAVNDTGIECTAGSSGWTWVAVLLGLAFGVALIKRRRIAQTIIKSRTHDIDLSGSICVENEFGVEETVRIDFSLADELSSSRHESEGDERGSGCCSASSNAGESVNRVSHLCQQDECRSQPGSLDAYISKTRLHQSVESECARRQNAQSALAMESAVIDLMGDSAALSDENDDEAHYATTEEGDEIDGTKHEDEENNMQEEEKTVEAEEMLEPIAQLT